MNVTPRPPGCAYRLGAVFSLGLLVIMQRAYRRQLPARLTDEMMILHDGRRIRWSEFTRLKVTRIYLKRAYIRTSYLLQYPAGKVEIGTDQVLDPDAVIQFILSHLPPEVVLPAP